MSRQHVSCKHAGEKHLDVTDEQVPQNRGFLSHNSMHHIVLINTSHNWHEPHIFCTQKSTNPVWPSPNEWGSCRIIHWLEQTAQWGGGQVNDYSPTRTDCRAWCTSYREHMCQSEWPLLTCKTTSLLTFYPPYCKSQLHWQTNTSISQLFLNKTTQNFACVCSIHSQT